MQITIQLDTDNPADVEVLNAVFGRQLHVTTEVSTVTGPEQTPEVPAPAAPKATKPKATPKVEPKVEEPVEEDLLGSETEVDLRQAAVDRATFLVTNGESARVRNALGTLGAKRVGDLQDAQFEAFLEAVAD